MTLATIRQLLFEEYQAHGYRLQPSAPLVHPYFPMSFNMSAGFVQLDPYIRGHQAVRNPEIITIQKCIRHFDISKAGLDGSHATFFEMFGALTLGPADKSTLIEQLHHLLTITFGLDQTKIAVSVFGSDTVLGRDFPKDEVTFETWKKLGYGLDQIFLGDGSNTFWFQGGNNLTDSVKTTPFEDRLCGSQTELFFDVTGKSCGEKCGPFCGCGRWLELANNLDIRYLYNMQTKSYSDLEMVATETVVGVERLACAVNNSGSIWKLDEYSLFYNTCITFLHCSDRHKQVLLDRLRTLLFLASEDAVVIGKSSRSRIVRTLVRDVLSIIYLNQMSPDREYIEVVAQELIDSLIETYSCYPELASGNKPLVKAIGEHHQAAFYPSMVHALESIRHLLLRGKIHEIGQAEKTQFLQTLGISPELVEKYFPA